ncbi:MAG TPA: hypothetical protein VGB99_04070 [Acidobacteriota bacterium]
MRIGRAFGLLAGLAASAGLGAQDLEQVLPAEKLGAGDLLVIGFQGGWKRFDDAELGPRRVKLWLDQRAMAGLHAVSFANKRRQVALELIRRCVDRNGDGLLQPEERDCGVRLALYGQSLGGSAVTNLAWELRALDIPVLLSVQVESVGYGDEEVPPNVALAANFYQYSGFLPRGEERIRALDPARTLILGNFGFDYDGPRGAAIGAIGQPWWSRLIENHHRIVDRDPQVWRQVEAMILTAYELRTVPYAELHAQANRFAVPDCDRCAGYMVDAAARPAPP